MANSNNDLLLFAALGLGAYFMFVKKKDKDDAAADNVPSPFAAGANSPAYTPVYNNTGGDPYRPANTSGGDPYRNNPYAGADAVIDTAAPVGKVADVIGKAVAAMQALQDAKISIKTPKGVLNILKGKKAKVRAARGKKVAKIKSAGHALSIVEAAGDAPDLAEAVGRGLLVSTKKPAKKVVKKHPAAKKKTAVKKKAVKRKKL